jgi:hypothetical protein
MTDRSATTDIVTQLEVAVRNPHAALIGALIGGLVPWFGRTLAHGQIQDAWTSNRTLAIAMIAVVVGCGVFSGLSVYKFGYSCFNDSRKAVGFVCALEGVMLVSHGVTSAVALIALILINAVSNGAVIALARDASQKKRAADARGAATRASNRANSRSGAPSNPGTAASAARVPYQAPAAPAVASMPPTIPARPDHIPGAALVVHSWQQPVVIDARVNSETRYLA